MWAGESPTVIAKAFKVLRGEGARGNPRTVATNTTRFNGKKMLNRDRGCWQLSNLYHPEVSDEQAFDPIFAAKKAHEIYVGAGHNFSRWCSADKVLKEKSC